MSSREGREYFIPWWCMARPSQTPMTPNSRGVPPARRTPAFTAWVIWFRWRWPGMNSLKELATPISGWSISRSVSPMALKRARWGYFSRPNFIRLLRMPGSLIALPPGAPGPLHPERSGVPGFAGSLLRLRGRARLPGWRLLGRGLLGGFLDAAFGPPPGPPPMPPPGLAGLRFGLRGLPFNFRDLAFGLRGLAFGFLGLPFDKFELDLLRGQAD